MEISELSSKLVWHFCCKIGTFLFYSSGYNIPSLICDPINLYEVGLFHYKWNSDFLKNSERGCLWFGLSYHGFMFFGLSGLNFASEHKCTICELCWSL